MIRSRLFVAASALAASVLPSCGSSSQAPEGEEATTGTATVALTRVPEDVKCLKLEVAGSRTVTKAFDVSTGESSVFRLERLPLGAATFKGAAYPSACSGVTAASAPSWVSEPKTAFISVLDIVNVVLKLFQNGKATVGVDFDPGYAPAEDAGAPPAEGTTSSQSAYLLPAAEGVQTKAILTVGDSPNLGPDGVTPYRLAGLIDGLGAFDNHDGTFTVLATHEIGATSGIARAHGGRGAFVSKTIVRKSDLAVLHSEDLMKQAVLWNRTTSSYDPPATGVSFSRFCSADLPERLAFFNPLTGVGYEGRLFLGGEEAGAEGRGVAHDLDGTTWELPRLGKFSYENAVAHPNAGDKTVVIGLDDATPGQVYVYVGTKTASGSTVDRAGLTNGKLFGVSVEGNPTESDANGIPAGTGFTGVDLGNVENVTGAGLEASSTAAGVTRWNRPEDGAWDPGSPNDFYFVTTGSFTTNSRLWRLRFVDPSRPELGGTVTAVLDGSEGQKMLDNIGIDKRGHIYATEDVGGNDHLGKVFRYDIATDSLTVVAQHDPARFAPGAPGFLTRDEEASGIFDASDILGDGWYLVDTQAHYNAGDPELVEGGQLLAIFDPAGAL